MKGQKRCGCVADGKGHPVHLCPMHAGLLESRMRKAKHKVFSGIRRSNPRRRITTYLEHKVPGGFHYFTKSGKRVSHEKVEREIVRGTATTQSLRNFLKEQARLQGWADSVLPLMEKSFLDNPRPPVGSPAYVKRRSERPPRRPPTKRLRKRRTKNRGRKVFPNPMGFVLFIQKESGKKMHFEGSKFSDSRRAKVFKDKSGAVERGRELLRDFPVLKSYRMTVEPYCDMPTGVTRRGK